MGTDIHLTIQANEDGNWRTVSSPPLAWHDESHRKHWPSVWFCDRNYDAFAILADVRNGRGFAGCYTGERLMPIAPERRGLPEGVALDGAQKFECYYMGEHSFHWITLRELADYPHRSKVRSVRGIVRPAVYERELRGRSDRVDQGGEP